MSYQLRVWARCVTVIHTAGWPLHMHQYAQCTCKCIGDTGLSAVRINRDLFPLLLCAHLSLLHMTYLTDHSVLTALLCVSMSPTMVTESCSRIHICPTEEALPTKQQQCVRFQTEIKNDAMSLSFKDTKLQSCCSDHTLTCQNESWQLLQTDPNSGWWWCLWLWQCSWPCNWTPAATANILVED